MKTNLRPFIKADYKIELRNGPSCLINWEKGINYVEYVHHLKHRRGEKLDLLCRV